MIKANDNVNIEDVQFVVKEIVSKIEKYLGYELVVTSGYRPKDHPVEIKKTKKGEHTEGLAIDVACSSPSQFYEIVSAACRFGIKRIGISRKSGFVHLGFNEERPTSVWVY